MIYWKFTRIEPLTVLQLHIGRAVVSHMIALTPVFTYIMDVLLMQEPCILSNLRRQIT